MVVFIAGVAGLGAISAGYYQIKLARRRAGWPLDRFVAEFEKAGVPPEISGTVYEYYRNHSVVPSYRVAPDDSLGRIYGASHEEVDDAAQAITERLGIKLPEERVLRAWPTPLETVRDMVLWTNWVRNPIENNLPRRSS
jgi:hypothetical protein